MKPTDMNKQVPAFALGQKGLIVFLAFLSSFVPISTDLYLPALPSMALYFKAAPELTSLTLSLFMLIFALSMLVWGPLSDKYGRKPILTTGLVIYIISSVGLALCTSIEQLIIGRCMQALGSGAVGGVCMAIVKDVFKGRTMENVLTWIQTITVLAPMLAPVLGGFLLNVTSWRGIFWGLTGCGALAFSGSLLLRETLENPTQGSVLASLGRVGFVLGHWRFSAPLIVFSMNSMAFMSYLATSSYIYADVFAVSPQVFSYFFAANAGVSILGPLLYLRFLRHLPRRGYIAGCFITVAVFGALLLAFGGGGPFTFALLFAPVTLAGSAIRPPSTMLLMTQLDTDNGTVGSLTGCTALLFGGLSMLLCSLPWPSFIAASGWICLGSGLVCTLGWLWLDRGRAYTRNAR